MGALRAESRPMHVRQRDCSVWQKQPFIHCAAFPASDRNEMRKPLDEGFRDKGSSPRQLKNSNRILLSTSKAAN